MLLQRWHQSLLSHRAACVQAVEAEELYKGFQKIQIQYGPAYRRLAQLWRSVHARVACGKLMVRATWDGTAVHPADLDDALCVCALASEGTSGGETRLPFAVDSAMLQGARGQLWTVAARQSAEAVSVRLGAIGAEMQAQLDGFKSRAMRADAPSSSHQRHLYVTEWRQTEAATSTAAETARMLVLDDGVLRSELALKLSSGTPRWPALVCAIATQRGRADRPARW